MARYENYKRLKPFPLSEFENIAVMLSEALQRNAKHEARLSNISDRVG
jgi:hypothetical protein